jgi:hypothetical protein
MRSRRLALVLSLSALPAVVVAACSATGSNTTASGGSGGQGAGSATGGTGGLLTDFDGGSSFGDANCGSKTFGNQVPGSILVVLDRSGSMSGGDGQPDKWAPTVEALEYVMSVADPSLEMGLLPFSKGDFNDSGLAACGLNPSSPQCAALFADGGCQDVADVPAVPVGPLSQTQGPISGWLAANGPQGGTPTLWALKKGYSYMTGYPAQGEKFVLLITDGEPNTYQPAMQIGPIGFPETNVECKTEADIIAEAAVAAGQGIKTFVIGSPGSEGGADFLSGVALEGQTGKDPSCSQAAGNCHYQIGQQNFQDDLQAVLEEIAGKITDCVFQLPAGNEMVDKDQVNVVIETASGPQEIYKDPSKANGWDYASSDSTAIVLYGEACEAFKSSEGNTISIILGCQTIVK